MVLPTRRRFEIRKKQKRRRKLKKLRELFVKTKSKKEKEKILEQVSKITPYLTEEEFLTSLKEKKENS